MKAISILAGGVLAASLLAGCASGGYGPERVTAVGYDGFYDDYYGPFNDGYWNNDGFFYYTDRGGIRHRDDGRHFRRDAAPGFHAVHGHAPGPGRRPG